MLPPSKRIVQARTSMNRIRTPVLLLWVAMIAACGTLGPTPSVDVSTLELEAERLLAEEQFAQSLQAYSQLVGVSTGSARSGYLIAGARILMELGAYDSARDWLGRAGDDATPAQEQQILQLQETIAATERGTLPTLERVALLLPLTGAQRSAAIAIQDGFVAAHLGDLQAGTRAVPALEVYDTGALGADAAYRRARDDGADFIVGPLLKPELEAILGSAGSTPTLALNSLEDGSAAANLYQFALAPEDEAREVARHAVANGARNAVALIPGNEWGNRLLNSFRMELESLGGQLLQYRTYNPGGQDFSGAITTVLNIDRSDDRHDRLRASLGFPLGFESRRRQDVDVIFVAAVASAGRLLVPQLRFYFAGDIPTYATSAIYESGNRNRDLDGLLFADTPWVLLAEPASQPLKATLQRYWPQRTSAQWTRFYGLGHDAYRLIYRLHGQAAALGSFPALSGELSLSEDGRVHRSLPLAQFRDGQPVAVAVEAGPVPESSAEIAELR